MKSLPSSTIKFVLGSLLLILFSVLQSCNKNTNEYSRIDYQVVNKTDSKIKVVFNRITTPAGYYQKIDDSVVYIEPSKQSTLVVMCFLSGESVANPEENTDSLYAIQTLRIFKNDTIPSSVNFIMTRYWKYEKVRNNYAELNLDVNNDDFDLK